MHGFAPLASLWLALHCDLSTACAAAESAARGVNLGAAKIYRVHMDTRVQPPAGGPRCIDVRVWHALPTNKPWSRAQAPYGTLEYHATPAALVEAEDDRRSTHILFQAKNGQGPGEEKHYISDFRVVSPDRSFDYALCHVDWHDINRYNAENKVTFPAPPAEISSLVEKLRYNKEPVETVQEFSKWLKENLTYDATCSTDGNDVLTTLSKRRGHCWHYMALIRAMCNAAGLQCRAVEGLNLEFSNGNNNIVDQARTDYTNGHVWAEIFFPEVGWVEIEPNGGNKCFNIPASYIQNNTKFQNYAVWITEQGRAPRPTKWILSGNKFVSDYGVNHKVSFTEEKR